MLEIVGSLGSEHLHWLCRIEIHAVVEAQVAVCLLMVVGPVRLLVVGACPTTALSVTTVGQRSIQATWHVS